MLIPRKELGTVMTAVFSLSATLCSTMGEQCFVSFSKTNGGISLIDAPIVVDMSDFKGMQIAVQSLSEDFNKVAGKEAKV